MDSTPEGRATEGREMHLKNAQSPMEMRLSGRVTWARELQR